MTMMHRDVWHAGEKAMQQSVGVAARMEEVGGRVIRDHMPDQHRAFYEQVPFIVAGSVDGRGAAWATLLARRPGFVASPTPTTLTLRVRPDATDPAGEGMRAGDAIGLLGIELHSRRRNRANGVIDAVDMGSADDIWHVRVGQSFGNCPQYIQQRDPVFVRDPALPFSGGVAHSITLDPAARAMIEQADTFFIASYVGCGDRRQVDVSHRGGRPGFIRVGADGMLTIPDFSGNSFFSTLGNILLNGQAGLAFVDFATGDMLQMTGNAEVLPDAPETIMVAGAERLWTFRPRHVVRRMEALPLRWTFRDNGWSPRTLATGIWGQSLPTP